MKRQSSLPRFRCAQLVRFEDCLKCCAVGPVGAGSWITAGHDQMVKLWDERSKPDKPAIAAAWLTWGGGRDMKRWWMRIKLMIVGYFMLFPVTATPKSQTSSSFFSLEWIQIIPFTTSSSKYQSVG